MRKENLIDKIMDAGLKNTKYRVHIIDLLSGTEELLSAQEIYHRLIHKKLRINLSTVYRTLDKLVETKIVSRVQIENEKQALYEYNRNIHHHFLICQSCNRIIPIYHCPLHEYEQKLEEESGFHITAHRVEFFGYCSDCQKSVTKHSS
ncbi:MAG: transcriptional repressor [Bacilli bacterium]|nr:transcriptional repressor [Bacilli bacterium]MBN2876664.1 transcriptional repressor [Bacilli bacterium]